MKYINIENTKIAYQEKGEGETIVLLHGYPENHHAWRFQFKELATEHRVIAIDWPGWGESDKSLDLDYSYEREVERLKNILDAMSIKECNLFVHDYGGFLGLGFALKYPEMVKRLAILNSRAHRSFKTPWYVAFSLVEKIARSPLAGLLEKLPLYNIHEQALKKDGLDDPIYLVYIKSYLDSMNTNSGKKWLVNFFRYYQTRLRPCLYKNLEKIDCPTAIIWGANDPYIPFETAVELTDRIPNARLNKIHDGQHFIMETHPEEVNSSLKELLKKPAKTSTQNSNIDLSKTETSELDKFITAASVIVPLIGLLILYRKIRGNRK